MSNCEDCGLPTHTITLDSGEEVDVCIVCDSEVVETYDGED